MPSLEALFLLLVCLDYFDVVVSVYLIILCFHVCLLSPRILFFSIERQERVDLDWRGDPEELEGVHGGKTNQDT